MRVWTAGLLGALTLGVLGCDGDGSGGDGGDPSTGATAGSDGTTGSSGSGGSTAGGSAQPPTEAELLAAGVIIGSCFPDDGINRNLARLLSPEHFNGTWDFTPQVRCIANAGGGCQAITECVGFTVSNSGGTDPSECVGSVMHYREPGYEATFDCASIGLVCDPEGACAPAGTESCDEYDYSGGCREGGRPTGCENGSVVVGPPCSDFGLTCSDGQCRGDGDSCPGGDGYNGADVEFEGLGCSGDTLLACTGRREHSVDCTSRGEGYGCREVNGFFFCGLGSECLPGEVTHGLGSEISCDGTEVVFCREGVWERIDCVSLGFTGCSDEVGQPRGCVPTLSAE